MPNAYANLKTIKSVSLLDISGGSHDTRLLELLEDTSRWIDQHCNRHFFTLQATRLFDVQRSSSQGAGARPGTHHVPQERWRWGQAVRHGMGLRGLHPVPPERRADPALGQALYQAGSRQRAAGASSEQGHIPRPRGRSTLQIAGVWGFREDLRTSAAVVDGMGIDAAATEFGVNGGMPFSPGDTLVIGSEQMYVTSTGTNKLKVERGVNGTSGMPATLPPPQSRRSGIRQASPKPASCRQRVSGNEKT